MPGQRAFLGIALMATFVSCTLDFDRYRNTIAPCDGTGSCKSCELCAEKTGGPCFNQFIACKANPECLKIVECGQPCGENDSACANNCILMYPMGESAFRVVLNCIACVCPKDCGVTC